MNGNNEEMFDPKGQGQPPPYTQSDLPQVMRPVMQTGQPTLVPIGQPMHDAMGRPIHIQHGTTLQPTAGMYQVQAAPIVIPMVVGNQMGPQPASISCPSCKEVIVTRVEAKSNTKTHMCAAILCVMCCWPCAIVPYFVDSCRNLDHYCPNCNAYIGSYVN